MKYLYFDTFYVKFEAYTIVSITSGFVDTDILHPVYSHVILMYKKSSQSGKRTNCFTTHDALHQISQSTLRCSIKAKMFATGPAAAVPSGK